MQADATGDQRRRHLFTATSEELNLPEVVVGRISRRENATACTFRRCSRSECSNVSDEYASFLHRYEDELYHLEEVRVVGGGPAFLNDAFELQREIAYSRRRALADSRDRSRIHGT